ncbi:MAG: FHA domain-containing protein [Anaerolinea sp.]|nr:FHA domain-containing protein [Anaerolinea sp.]
MLCLIMRRGPTPGATFELDADEITIGRGIKNHIVIHDNEVSREHCLLVRLLDGYEVQDLHSNTGTFVNGQRVIASWVLTPGCLIEIGDTITLEYGHYDPAREEALSAPEAQYAAHLFNPDAAFGLMMTMGPAVGYLYELSKPLIKVGRDLSNDLVIQDPEVSRFHIRLTRTLSGYTVEDLNSTNGTTINGVPLKGSIQLEPNHVIKLGSMVQLQFIHQVTPGTGSIDNPRPRKLVDANANYVETLQNIFIVKPKEGTPATSMLGTGIDPGSLVDHIFIAYARKDWQSLVAPLMVTLQSGNLKAWVDQYLAQGSKDWMAAVEQALGECWLMAVLWSAEAAHSNYVKIQYRYFLQYEKPLIVLQCDDTPLPTELTRARVVNYQGAESRSFHKVMYEIINYRRLRGIV